MSIRRVALTHHGRLTLTVAQVNSSRMSSLCDGAAMLPSGMIASTHLMLT